MILSQDNDYLKLKLQCHDEIKDLLLSEVSLKHFSEDSVGLNVSNKGGWHSKYDTMNESNPLHNEIISLCEPTINQLRVRENTSFNLNLDYWWNINYKNDLNSLHNHLVEPMNNLLSGVYYLSKPKNSGDLVMPSERWYLKRYFQNDFDTVIECDEGDVVIFYPHVQHYVQPNLSDDPRISMAFNLRLSS